MRQKPLRPTRGPSATPDSTRRPALPPAPVAEAANRQAPARAGTSSRASAPTDGVDGDDFHPAAPVAPTVPDGLPALGATAAPAAASPRLTREQWGAFLGRLVSRATSPEEERALGSLVQRRRFPQTLARSLAASGAFAAGAQGQAEAERVAAGLALALRAESGPVAADEAPVLDVLGRAAVTPTLDDVPPSSLSDGDLERTLLEWVRTSSPTLAAALVQHHPHIPTPAQLPAVSEEVALLAQESGPFLEGFNVLAVMHQMGRTVPWLQLLEQRLGLRKDQYVGVSVPYSESAISVERLRQEGYETRSEHDPRPSPVKELQQVLGGGRPRGFDELKEEELRRALERMLELHAENGKPIVVIDDGGYVCEVLRKHFPGQEHLFRLVEWTTRGVRRYEALSPEGPLLVSGAESRPKTELEPAFIADSVVEHLDVLMQAKKGGLRGKRLLVVGAGNVGLATALMAKDAGAVVTLTDRDPKRLPRSARGLALERDLEAALAGQDVVLAITGNTSLPSGLFGKLDPDTLVVSASSADIETRDANPALNGTWDRDLRRLSISVRNFGPPAPSSAARGGPAAAEDVLRDAVAASLERSLGTSGFQVEVEGREIARGGFVLNLSRRVRVMPVQREELILMNVTESLAQACLEPAEVRGKQALAASREERVARLFAAHHPEHAASARALQARVAALRPR